MHACIYDVCVYNAAEILSPTDEPTDKAILGVGWDIKTQILRYVSACLVARYSNCPNSALCIGGVITYTIAELRLVASPPTLFQSYYQKLCIYLYIFAFFGIS